MIDRGKDKRPRLRAVAIAAALVVAGVAGFAAFDRDKPSGAFFNASPTAPKLMAAGNDVPSTPDPAQPAPRPKSRTPIMDKVSLLSRYDRLASSGDPVDAKAAYDIAQWCIDNLRVSQNRPDLTEQAREVCGDLTMRPGILTAQEQLKLVQKAAEAGVHRAYIELYRDHVKGRPPTLPPGPETEAYAERLRQIALSTADPAALVEEMTIAREHGDTPQQLALFVAYRASLARDRGQPYDPATDEPTQQLAARLDKTTAQAAIAKGAQYVAANYRSHS